MSNSKSFLRKKYDIKLTDPRKDAEYAKLLFYGGYLMEAFDIFEKIISVSLQNSIEILAEVYNLFASMKERDRYNLYQKRIYNFNIKYGDKVLDFGSGHLPFPLATHLSDISLTDDNYGRAGIPFNFIEGKPTYEFSLDNIPFGDKEFDFVYCSHVLEHTENPERACKELIRVGKRGYIETPTRAKDLWMNSAKISNHKWVIEYLNETLTFSKYTEEEIEGLQNNILMLMHVFPESKREKAFSALIYLKPEVLNTMLMWEDKFNFKVLHLYQEKDTKVSKKQRLIKPGLNANNEKIFSEIYTNVELKQPIEDKGVNTPVILITYNRPQHTQKVINILREHKLNNLYIFSDSPKTEKDVEGVNATRELINAIDWTTPNVTFQQVNQGLAKSIVQAVNKVFEKYDQLILLEDDCVPQTYFFDFMIYCLKQYRNNENIYGISGYSIQIPKELRDSYPYDLYFFPRIGSWGWGTWKRAWQKKIDDLDFLRSELIKQNIDLEQGGNDVPLMLDQISRGELKDVWTMSWILTVYLNKGYYIYPTESHIKNIGLDGSGVHCGTTEIYNSLFASQKPEKYSNDVILDKRFFENFRKYYDLNLPTPHIEIQKVNNNPSIIHLATMDIGGAGKSAYRLHKGLQSVDCNSKMLVVKKNLNDCSIEEIKINNGQQNTNEILKEQLEFSQLGVKSYPNRPLGLEIFTECNSGIKLHKIEEIKKADLINLHWTAGMLDLVYMQLAFYDKPVVWTLHDMNAFTGGCHYSGDCTKYKSGCGACPQLGSNDENDLSRKTWQKKIKAYRNLNLTIVTPSKWLAECACQSPLFENCSINVIPYGIPLDVFKSNPYQEITKAFEVLGNTKLILFGADYNTPRKGLNYLVEALRIFLERNNDIQIILGVFGYYPDDLKLPSKCSVIKFGRLNEESKLSKIYNLADVFIVPSLEDNLPNVIIEAMACGLPVIGFNTGGIVDLIDHKQNGYVAKIKDAGDLAEGLRWILFEGNKEELKQYSIKKVQREFALEIQALRYKTLYQKIINDFSNKQLDEKAFIGDQFYKAEDLIQEERYLAAKEVLKFILNIEPDNINALNDLAVTSILLNEFKQANRFLLQILNLSPRNEVALINKQYLESLPGYPEFNNYFFKDKTTCNSSDELALSDINPIIKAEEKIQAGNYQSAKQILNTILDQDSQNVDALNDMSVIEILTGNYSQAIINLKQVLQCDWENKAALNNIIYLINNKMTSEFTNYFGFYKDEGTFRWIDKEAELKMQYYLLKYPLNVSFKLSCVKKSAYQKFPFDVKIFLNNELVDQLTFDFDDKNENINLLLPVSNSDSIIKIISSQFFVPAEAGLEDTRRLSVIFSALTLCYENTIKFDEKLPETLADCNNQTVKQVEETILISTIENLMYEQNSDKVNSLVENETCMNKGKFLKLINGIYVISDMPYQFNEEEYDSQYGYCEINQNIRKGFSKILIDNRIDNSYPLIEIGAGTGVLSLPILQDNKFPLYIITDSSTNFLKLLQNKMNKADIKAKTKFCAMKAEELELFPDNSFSVIALRYVLHHLNDWKSFIGICKEKLVEGGALIFEEPLSNGFVLEAFAVQFLPALANMDANGLTNKEQWCVDHLKNITDYYLKKSIDKSWSEDKHVFQIEEILDVAQEFKLSCRAYPGTGIDKLDPYIKDNFMEMFLYNCKNNLSFPQSFVDKLKKYLSPYTDFIEKIDAENLVSYNRGVILLKAEN